MSVVDTLEHWNWWGQLVVLVLIQIGGLGFSVGASILLQMLRRGAGAYTLRDELLLKDGAPALSIQEAVYLAGRIVRFTFVVEVIGAVAARHLVCHGRRTCGRATRSGTGCSTPSPPSATPGSISPAGFARCKPAATDVWVNLVLIALIQAGALSYIVFADVARASGPGGRWRSIPRSC